MAEEVGKSDPNLYIIYAHRSLNVEIGAPI
jgi:hypothetical protein